MVKNTLKLKLVNSIQQENIVPNNSSIKLVLNWYEIKGNNLIGEEIIKDINSDDILKLFKTPFWNRLYHCWVVKKNHIKILQKHVGHKINTAEYCYFVEIINISNS